MEAIQFVGLNELEDVDQEMVQTLCTEYYGKIQRELKNDLSLKIHIKTYKKEGARHKYSVHIKAIAPTKIFESTHAADWDLASSMHKAFKDLEREITHHFHSD